MMPPTSSTFFFGSTLLLLTIAAAAVDGAAYSGGTAEAEADRVRSLPGQPPVKFRHYAGYVKLGPHSQKALFYWFFEAQQAPSHKPLVLWLNGGPGCSSIGYGAALELGPFLVQNEESVTLNKFSWNKVANILFLESPVGVGFSYTNNSKDLMELGDQVTAIDNYAFLIQWFKRFPTFKSHDFYIAGESYAGHYVPQLAELIYEGNKDTKKGSHINLKGFMIGNGVINDVSDTEGIIEYAWSHAIISDELYKGIKKDCDFSVEKVTRECGLRSREFLEAYSEIDIYSIYSPICLSIFNTTSTTASPLTPKLMVAPHLLTQYNLWHKIPSGYDPCGEEKVAKYFNRQDVQNALHANITNLFYPYSLCSCMYVWKLMHAFYIDFVHRPSGHHLLCILGSQISIINPPYFT